MRAAVLTEFGKPLSIQSLPDPVLGTGEVIVDIAAAAIANYAAAIFSGARNYMLELPIAPGPGGIGRVREKGPDSTNLSIGDWVYCDSVIRSRDDAINPDMILLGWTAANEAALPLHRYFHHGSFAEQVLLPTENVTPIGDIPASEAGRWCAVGQLLVPYGGLVAAGLQAGETLVINGATGGFGSAGVAVALAMGAARVVATGRNESALNDIARVFGPRVRTAVMTGNESDDRRAIGDLAGGPIDAVLDLLPREASTSQVLAAMLTVRPSGRVILMGGVGRSGGADLEIPYPWLMRNDITVRGKWMYSRDVIPRLIQLVQTGQIDLNRYDITEFALNDAVAAVDHAATNSGPLRLTVLRPDQSGPAN